MTGCYCLPLGHSNGLRRGIAAAAVVTAVLGTNSAAAADALRLTPEDRVDMGLTLYTDFAVVRDVREANIPDGRVEVAFEGISPAIDPTSVRVRGENLEVLWQSYAFDLASPQSLLAHYIGETVSYALREIDDGEMAEVIRQGTLLSVNPEIVRFDEGIEISPQGVLTLPELKEGITTTPTLRWQLENPRQGDRRLATYYITNGIGWRAEYTVLLDQTGQSFDLASWIDIDNHSGMTYAGSGLKLVAGAVKRERQGEPPNPMAMQRMAMDMAESEAAGPVRRSLADYHLYEYEGEFLLGDNETAQLRFAEADDVSAEKTYISVSPVPMHQMPQAQEGEFDVRYEFDNAAKGPLGEPLPAGRVRVMKEDEDGAWQLLGEDSIDHTPVGETVELTVGKAFDLGVERTQQSWRRVGERGAEVTMIVTVSNAKDEPVELVLHEKFYGDWQVVSQSADGKKIDSTTLEYVLEVEGGEERTVTYTVRSTF